MALLSRPFCPYNSRQAGLWYLPARWRDTTTYCGAQESRRHAGRRASVGGFSAPNNEARCPGGDDRDSDGGDEAGDSVAEKAGERVNAANIERAEISW